MIARAIARTAPAVSLFDRFDWAYALMREHCFRDDTARIDAALWADGRGPSRAVELACGPGTYARRLSRRHPALRVLGIDNSPRMIERARRAAGRDGAACEFALADVLYLPLRDASVDAVIASRLLMMVPDPKQAIDEMRRVLSVGGRCFIAEPRPSWLSRLPMDVMRLLAWPAPVRERLEAIGDATFARIVASADWRVVTLWADDRYRYAVCERDCA